MGGGVEKATRGSSIGPMRVEMTEPAFPLPMCGTRLKSLGQPLSDQDWIAIAKESSLFHADDVSGGDWESESVLTERMWVRSAREHARSVCGESSRRHTTKEQAVHERRLAKGTVGC